MNKFLDKLKQKSINFQIRKLSHCIIILFANCFIGKLANSQTLSPRVIATSGGYNSNVNGSLSFTIGEMNTRTLTSSTNMLTQGFQQSYKLRVNLKAFIQGYYAGSGLLQSVLNNEGQSNPLTDVDTVTIELHNIVSPFALHDSYTGILQTDGSIACTFANSSEGDAYYVVFKHRNALQTWSANPLLLNTSVYDFTTSASKAYGNNQIEVEPNVFAFYSGDINQDEVIDGSDVVDIENGTESSAFGYISADLNGDGSVDGSDYPMWDANSGNSIYSIHP